jgi:hypothetical protein
MSQPPEKSPGSDTDADKNGAANLVETLEKQLARELELNYLRTFEEAGGNLAVSSNVQPLTSHGRDKPEAAYPTAFRSGQKRKGALPKKLAPTPFEEALLKSPLVSCSVSEDDGDEEKIRPTSALETIGGMSSSTISPPDMIVNKRENPSAKWTCKRCTLDNVASQSKCTACEASRFVVGQEMQALFNQTWYACRIDRVVERKGSAMKFEVKELKPNGSKQISKGGNTSWMVTQRDLKPAVEEVGMANLPYNARPVVQLDMDGVKLRVFGSVHTAVKSTPYIEGTASQKRKHITACCRGEKEEVGGFQWRFNATADMKPSPPPQPAQKQPAQKQNHHQMGSDSDRDCNDTAAITGKAKSGSGYSSLTRMEREARRLAVLAPGPLMVSFDKGTTSRRRSGKPSPSKIRRISEASGTSVTGIRANGEVDMTQCKAVEQLDINTESIICVHASVKSAADAVGAQHQNISACCRGERVSSSSYKWRYATLADTPEQPPPSLKNISTREARNLLVSAPGVKMAMALEATDSRQRACKLQTKAVATTAVKARDKGGKAPHRLVDGDDMAKPLHSKAEVTTAKPTRTKPTKSQPTAAAESSPGEKKTSDRLKDRGVRNKRAREEHDPAEKGAGEEKPPPHKNDEKGNSIVPPDGGTHGHPPLKTARTKAGKGSVSCCGMCNTMVTTNYRDPTALRGPLHLVHKGTPDQRWVCCMCLIFKMKETGVGGSRSAPATWPSWKAYMDAAIHIRSFDLQITPSPLGRKVRYLKELQNPEVEKVKLRADGGFELVVDPNSGEEIDDDDDDAAEALPHIPEEESGVIAFSVNTLHEQRRVTMRVTGYDAYYDTFRLECSSTNRRHSEDFDFPFPAVELQKRLAQAGIGGGWLHEHVREWFEDAKKVFCPPSPGDDLRSDLLSTPAGEYRCPYPCCVSTFGDTKAVQQVSAPSSSSSSSSLPPPPSVPVLSFRFLSS